MKVQYKKKRLYTAPRLNSRRLAFIATTFGTNPGPASLYGPYREAPKR